jgi:hypothetical protein
MKAVKSFFGVEIQLKKVNYIFLKYFWELISLMIVLDLFFEKHCPLRFRLPKPNPSAAQEDTMSCALASPVRGNVDYTGCRISRRRIWNYSKVFQTYRLFTKLALNPQRLRSQFAIIFLRANLTAFLSSFLSASSGQSSWLQIQRSRVRFPARPDFLRSSVSGTGSTQPHEYNWGATWMEK